MKLIVGLGNIGKEYEHTRHNAGFDAIDKLAELLKVEFKNSKFNGQLATYGQGDDKVFLLKPSTFMNNSGESVIAIVNFYKINVEDIIVVHDDMDLPVGKIRLREKGSSGGQKGMQSIMNHLNTQDIKRIKVGIGHDRLIPVVDYVLGKTKKEDLEVYDEALTRASKALQFSIKNPFSLTMNRYNK